MTHYVIISKIRTVESYETTVVDFRKMCKGNANYDSGGWSDKSPKGVWPHIEFEFEEDAILYILKFGGNYTNKYPYRTNKLLSPL